MAEARLGAADVEAEEDERDEEKEAAATSPTALRLLLIRLSIFFGFGRKTISDKRQVVLWPQSRERVKRNERASGRIWNPIFFCDKRAFRR